MRTTKEKLTKKPKVGIRALRNLLRNQIRFSAVSLKRLHATARMGILQ